MYSLKGEKSVSLQKFDNCSVKIYLRNKVGKIPEKILYKIRLKSLTHEYILVELLTINFGPMAKTSSFIFLSNISLPKNI